MKRIALSILSSVVLVTLAIMYLAVLVPEAKADNVLPPRRGTFTNSTVSVTNTISKRWIIFAMQSGVYDGTNLCQTAVNNGSGFFTLAEATSTTNTLSYIDGDAAVPWEVNGVMRFVNSAAAAITNKYTIITIPERK